MLSCGLGVAAVFRVALLATLVLAPFGSMAAAAECRLSVLSAMAQADVSALTRANVSIVSGDADGAQRIFDDWVARARRDGAAGNDQAVRSLLNAGRLAAQRRADDEALCLYQSAYRLAAESEAATPRQVSDATEALVRAMRINKVEDAEAAALALQAALQRIPGNSPRTLLSEKSEVYGALLLARRWTGARGSVRQPEAPGSTLPPARGGDNRGRGILDLAVLLDASRRPTLGEIEQLIDAPTSGSRETQWHRRVFLVDFFVDELIDQGACLEASALAAKYANPGRDAILGQAAALRCHAGRRGVRDTEVVAEQLVAEVHKEVSARVRNGQLFQLRSSSEYYGEAASAVREALAKSPGSPRRAALLFQAAQLSQFTPSVWSLAFVRQLDLTEDAVEKARLVRVLRAEAVFQRFASAGDADRSGTGRNRLSRGEFEAVAREWGATAEALKASAASAPIGILPTLSEVQNRLEAESALITIDVEGETIWLTVVRRNVFETVASPVPTSTVLRHARSLRESIDPYGSAQDLSFDFDAALGLHDALVKPLAHALDGATLIYWAPDAAIGSIPPAVLVSASPAGVGLEALQSAPWLARERRFVIVAAPMAVVRRARTSAPAAATYLGVGDPQTLGGTSSPPARDESWRGRRTIDELSKLPSLPETAAEISSVSRHFSGRATTLLGVRATEASVRRLDLKKFSILHFATHGLVGGEIGGLADPALVLSSPDEIVEAGDDGLLTTGEISLLRLDADWVVLSACNTAAPGFALMRPEQDPLSGFSRAFLLAGARNLLVSHWAVDSASSVALTTAAFDAWRAGQSRSRSLAHAMSRVREDGAHPYWAHPRYWAPYVLVSHAAD